MTLRSFWKRSRAEANDTRNDHILVTKYNVISMGKSRMSETATILLMPVCQLMQNLSGYRGTVTIHEWNNFDIRFLQCDSCRSIWNTVEFLPRVKSSMREVCDGFELYDNSEVQRHPTSKAAQCPSCSSCSLQWLPIINATTRGRCEDCGYAFAIRRY